MLEEKCSPSPGISWAACSKAVNFWGIILYQWIWPWGPLLPSIPHSYMGSLFLTPSFYPLFISSLFLPSIFISSIFRFSIFISSLFLPSLFLPSPSLSILSLSTLSLFILSLSTFSLYILSFSILSVLLNALQGRCRIYKAYLALSI
jgi:hypothetical protein